MIEKSEAAPYDGSDDIFYPFHNLNFLHRNGPSRAIAQTDPAAGAFRWIDFPGMSEKAAAALPVNGFPGTEAHSGTPRASVAKIRIDDCNL